MTIKLKTLEAVGSESATYSEFELDANVSESVKTKIQQDVGEFIVEQVLQTIGNAKSPVSGESWGRLSKDYKSKKVGEGLPGEADMENTGALKDALTFKTGDTLKVGFFNSEAWKADGHLKFSGADGTAPRRRFLPDEGQKFISSIQSGIDKIVADNILESDAIDAEDLDGIESKAELYATLKDRYPDLSRAQIRLAITRNPRLTNLFEDLDLLDLL